MRKNTNETFEILSEARRKEPIQDIKKGTRPQVTILKSERKTIKDEEMPSSRTNQNFNLTLQNKLAARFTNVTMPQNGSKTDREERHAMTMPPYNRDGSLLLKNKTNNLQSRFFSLRR